MTNQVKKEFTKIGHIVQLNPETSVNKAFGGCFLTVTEIYDWGVQGYVQNLGSDRDNTGGQAYYRAKWETLELTGGQARWLLKDDEDAKPN